ncbi:MAG TPA: hypothetical protein VIW64_10030 [Pyrinomonadaceae bacterium]
MAEANEDAPKLAWKDLPGDVREHFNGRLSGMFGAVDDEVAFNNCAVDKQQTLLLMLARLREKDLWHVIRKIDNVYGEHGVGLGFKAWPFIHSTLSQRNDFTRLFANHKDTTGGFYEKGRAEAVLHFLYQDGEPRQWFVHFDLHSPVHSPVSMFKHMRHEAVGKLTPNWRMIRDILYSTLSIGA